MVRTLNLLFFGTCFEEKLLCCKCGKGSWTIPICSSFWPIQATLSDAFAVHLGLVASLIAFGHAEDQPAIDELVEVLATSEFADRTFVFMARDSQTFHHLFAVTKSISVRVVFGACHSGQVRVQY